MKPRAFYHAHVISNYEAWFADHTNRAKAMNAVSEANNMAEYMYHYLRGNKPELLHDAQSVGEYRTHLANKECPDFQIIRDVADGHKHLELTRQPRLVSGTGQVKADALKWNDDKTVTWQEADFTWADTANLFMVVLDSGERRILRVAVKRVLAMWERLLGEIGL